MSLVLVDIAIALVVVFIMASVFCSGILEWYSQKTGARGRFLRTGLLRMLGDDALFRQVINHPLIRNMGREPDGHGPSYVPPRALAAALIDSVCARGIQLAGGPAGVRTSPIELDELRQHIQTLAAAQFSVASTLALMARRSDSIAVFAKAIEDWFEAQNERVTGWYKSFARWHLFVIGLIVAVLFNLDLIAITRSVVADPALRNTLSATGRETDFRALNLAAPAIVDDEKLRDAVKEQLKASLAAGKRVQEAQARGLPVGWSAALLAGWRSPTADPAQRLLEVLGWLLMALGISLGAPFWFDLLNKLINLRGAGPAPAPAPAPMVVPAAAPPAISRADAARNE